MGSVGKMGTRGLTGSKKRVHLGHWVKYDGVNGGDGYDGVDGYKGWTGTAEEGKGTKPNS